MTAVPQAAMDALNAHEYRHSDLGRGWHCRCGGFFDNIGQHRAHVAAAVVAAVQGPIKAEALRGAAGELDDGKGFEPKHLSGGFVRGVRLALPLTARWLRARADRIEAEPPADAHAPEERILRDILTNQPE